VDPSLIETVASHGTFAFDDVFEATFPQLVRILTVVCGDRDVATAFAAEAFERAFVRWRRVSRLDDPAEWIRRDAIRGAGHTTGRATCEQTTDDPLLLALAALPFDRRAIVALCEVGGLGPAEIARAMGIREEAVRSQLDEAREHIRTAWDPGDDAFDHVVQSYLHHVVHGPIDPAGELDRRRPRFARARRRRTARVGLAAAAVLTVVLLGVTSLTHDRRAVSPRADPPTTVAPRPPATPDLSAATTSTVVSPTSHTVPLAAPGGIVVVRVDGSDVMLVTATPAPGWAVAETRTDGGRVGVRFRLDGTPDVSEVVARVEDGQFIGQVE
jgi:RNA polymerase sigma-70 factor, ECF subfamily